MRNFVESFVAAFLKVTGTATRALYLYLLEEGEVELTSSLMRSHIFHYGLFGHRATERTSIFLEQSEADTIARDGAAKNRELHLKGRFLWGLWEWNSLYTMLDTGAWDDCCRSRLKQFLSDPKAVDGLSLMLFGGAFVTGRDTISKMVDREYYLECVDKRLGEGDVSETARVAMKKAKDPLFP